MSSTLFDPLFDKIRKRVKKSGHPDRIGIIVSAGDYHMLDALIEPTEKGWLKPIFYGNSEVITPALDQAGLDRRKCILADAIDREARIIAMMESVLDGGITVLCIGPDAATRNFDLLKKARSEFFPTESLGCGVAAIAIPDFTRLIFVADVTMRAEPTIDERIEIVNHCIDVAKSCSVTFPKVAMLAEILDVDTEKSVTRETQQISGGIGRDDTMIEGPVSLDMAMGMISPEVKEISSEGQHKADCLIGTDITLSRSIYQTAVSHNDAQAGTVMVGGKVPVALPGREDGSEGLLLSTLLAMNVASNNRV